MAQGDGPEGAHFSLGSEKCGLERHRPKSGRVFRSSRARRLGTLGLRSSVQSGWGCLGSGHRFKAAGDAWAPVIGSKRLGMLGLRSSVQSGWGCLGSGHRRKAAGDAWVPTSVIGSKRLGTLQFWLPQSAQGGWGRLGSGHRFKAAGDAWVPVIGTRRLGMLGIRPSIQGGWGQLGFVDSSPEIV